MKVFIGHASNGEDAESQAVLEYTLRLYASEPLDITWMGLSPDRASPWNGWNTAGWGTPFTGLRWAIPEVCGFAGRAIYLDSDMICRGDIAQLWRADIPVGAAALVRGQGRKMRCCVMLLNCAAFLGRILPLARLKTMTDQHGAMVDRLTANPAMFAQLDPAWNVVDLKGGFEIGAAKLLHYSSIAHQPQLRHALPRLAKAGARHWYDGEVFDHWRPEIPVLFDQLLEEAAVAGFTPDRYIPAPGMAFGPYGIKSYKGVPVKGFS